MGKTIDSKQDPPAQPPADPQAGGQYLRDEGGALILIGDTKPASGRTRRAPVPAVPVSTNPTE